MRSFLWIDGTSFTTFGSITFIKIKESVKFRGEHPPVVQPTRMCNEWHQVYPNHMASLVLCGYLLWLHIVVLCSLNSNSHVRWLNTWLFTEAAIKALIRHYGEWFAEFQNSLELMDKNCEHEHSHLAA